MLTVLTPSAVSALTFDTFDDWTVTANGGNGVAMDSAVRFSYGWGEISRTFIVEEPSLVTLTVDVFNANTNTVGWKGATPDRYLVALGAQELRGEEIHDWKTVTVTVTTSSPMEELTVRLGGIDSGFWAGFYGPVMDNVSIIAEALTPPTTTEPATTTTTEPETTTSSSSTTTELPTTTTTMAETTTTATVPQSSSTLASTTSTTLAVTTDTIATTTSTTTITPETVPALPESARTVVRHTKSGTTMTPEQRTTVVAATLLLIFPTSIASPSDQRNQRRR
jgi:hypothetical protein